jgi:hypothetical protein
MFSNLLFFFHFKKEYMSVQNRLEAEKQEMTNNLKMVEKKLNEEKSRIIKKIKF